MPLSLGASRISWSSSRKENCHTSLGRSVSGRTRQSTCVIPTRVSVRGASAPRSFGNLHELLHLLGGEWRGNEFPRHGVGHDLIDALDPVGGNAFLRDKIAHAQDDLLRQA